MYAVSLKASISSPARYQRYRSRHRRGERQSGGSEGELILIIDYRRVGMSGKTP